MTSLLIPAPLPWEAYEPAMFRLPGFGGAALFLRTTVVPDLRDEPRPCLGYDIGFLSPASFTRYLGRLASADLPGRLSAFFLAIASDENPESGVNAFWDEHMGLRIAVTASDATTVTLLVTLNDGPSDEEEEPDGLDFGTSRAVLAQAAFDVRYLDPWETDPGGIAVPPDDWSTQ